MMEMVLIGSCFGGGLQLSMVLKGFKSPYKIFPLYINHFEGFEEFEGVFFPSSTYEPPKNGEENAFCSYAIFTPPNPANPSNPLCRSGWALKGGRGSWHLVTLAILGPFACWDLRSRKSRQQPRSLGSFWRVPLKAGRARAPGVPRHDFLQGG